ncbi:FMN-binding protein MioC [Shewanella sp. NIFS-20-20]|uniref:FMN-binding protein MioC n=1 Tax=Shewanella sp. NIFS-20-20 TaxID=2853806 RepID=UPI001C438C1F|nr:FMN-binding protein MioC [Shewanella sp. NIFS-20-20]MBV7315594.1 FMN-binding protein MioC [Shewanella sp. NIFS-20-20]
MSKIDVIVGTTLGGTEYVADEIVALLTDAGHQVELHLSPSLADIDKKSLWLIVSSTHGAGELPDNLQPFFKDLRLTQPDLTDLTFALCAIGDSNYDTFCQGPEALISELSFLGARTFVDKIQIDVQQQTVPEDLAIQWLNRWISTL